MDYAIVEGGSIATLNASNTEINLSGIGMVRLEVSQTGNNNYNSASQSIAFEVIDGTITSLTLDQNVGLALYPNPASSILKVNHNVSSGIKSWQIVDGAGNTVSTGQKPFNGSIEVNELSEGLYFIKLDFAEFQETKRFIIMR